MPPFETVVAGFADAFTLGNLIFVIFGVALGQLVGAIPGIGPVMTMAIAIPFTFTMSPLVAVSFLIGINKGGLFGGAIPAILINTPGTPDAAATAYDGYPLSAKGKPAKATKMALYASVTGDTFSDLVLILASAPIAVLALRLGPVEVCALMVLAFATIAGLVGDSLVKGFIAALLGLLLSTVRLDPRGFSPRFDFGYFQLYDGLDLVSMAVGMLAVAEIIRRIADRDTAPDDVTAPQIDSAEAKSVSWIEYWSCRWTMFRGALIGTAIGALPGIGSTAAAYLSYAAVKRTDPGDVPFGEGNLKGIAATESANSAVMGANLIPLLGIGIPGSISAALLVSAFVIHGIQPGPLLFRNQGELIYGLFGAMLMANLCNLLVGHLSLRAWTIAVRAPTSVIFPGAMIFCIAGVYLSSGGIFGVVIMFLAAGLSLVLTSVGIPVTVLLITFFLGERFENTLAQSLTILNGNVLELVHYPIAIGLLGAAIALSIYMGRHHFSPPIEGE